MHFPVCASQRANDGIDVSNTGMMYRRDGTSLRGTVAARQMHRSVIQKCRRQLALFDWCTRIVSHNPKIGTNEIQVRVC
jgi:hypothetical protein